MNRDEAMRAAETLGKSPAAKWIGNKLTSGVLLQKCMRCGAEETLELPTKISRPSDVPIGFDEKLFAWKRDFQIAHETCPDPDEKDAEP